MARRESGRLEKRTRARAVQHEGREQVLARSGVHGGGE